MIPNEMPHNNPVNREQSGSGLVICITDCSCSKCDIARPDSMIVRASAVPNESSPAARKSDAHQ